MKSERGYLLGRFLRGHRLFGDETSLLENISRIYSRV